MQPHDRITFPCLIKALQVAVHSSISKKTVQPESPCSDSGPDSVRAALGSGFTQTFLISLSCTVLGFQEGLLGRPGLTGLCTAREKGLSVQ